MTLLFLSAIFYVGVLLNVNLLDLSATQETTIQIGALAFLLAVIIIGLLLAVRKARRPYLFYHSKITQGKKEIAYASMVNTEPASGILGKMFKTYSINLGDDFHLRHIPQEIKIQDYIKQMREYAKNQRV